MKIRNGFVSNSSSSSFVVAFPCIPKSPEEVRDILFESRDSVLVHPYDDEVYSADDVSEVIFRDIINNNNYVPLDREHVENICKSGSLVDHPKAQPFFGNISDFDEYFERQEKAAVEAAEEFIEENSNTFIYSFNYGDDNGVFEAALEHGNLFHKLPHIRISQH